MTVLRDAAIALAATALMASPALAQQGNWNGSQGYQGPSGQRGYSQEYNEGTSQGWNQNSNAAAPGTNSCNGNRTAYNSGSNRSNNNNDMTGTKGYNGNYDTGSNQGSTGYNPGNGITIQE